MEIRDIINVHGIKIGELILADNTPEEVWQEKLAYYNANGLPAIPDITSRQIRQALFLSGVPLNAIDDAIDSLPEPVRTFAKIEWEYSIAFKRRRSLVDQVGILMGWSTEQLDQLWIMAGKLE